MNKLEKLHLKSIESVFDDTNSLEMAEKSAEITTDVAIKFAEWLSNKRYTHQDRNLYLAPFPVVSILTTEELFEIFINNHYGK
jgi:hypothetical protein